MGTTGEQFAIFAIFNPKIKLKLMKVTAFIRKMAKKKDLGTKSDHLFPPT